MKSPKYAVLSITLLTAGLMFAADDGFEAGDPAGFVTAEDVASFAEHAATVDAAVPVTEAIPADDAQTGPIGYIADFVNGHRILSAVGVLGLGAAIRYRNQIGGWLQSARAKAMEYKKTTVALAAAGLGLTAYLKPEWAKGAMNAVRNYPKTSGILGFLGLAGTVGYKYRKPIRAFALGAAASRGTRRSLRLNASDNDQQVE